MPAPSFVARQLARPSGWFGRYIMGTVMNRGTADHNLMVLEDLEVSPDQRVLEVGFGGAALLRRLCEQASTGFVSGLEVSDEMIARANRVLRAVIASGRLELRQGAVESMPYRDGEFDRCCSVNTIYFWRDLSTGLAECHRVLRPRGRLVIGFLAADSLRGAGFDRQGFSAYSPGDVRAALAAADFEPGRLRSGADRRGAFHSLAAERRPAGGGP